MKGYGTFLLPVICSLLLLFTVPGSTVSISSPDSSPISGASYTLTCTSSSSAIVWKKGQGGTTLSTGVGDVTDIGMGSHERSLTFDPLRAVNGGIYTCEAGSETGDTTLIVQAPTLAGPQLFPTGTLSIFYAGTQLTFQCLIVFTVPITDPDFSIYLSWFRNSSSFPADNRITFDTTPIAVSPTIQYTGTQEFEYITLSDAAVYSCNITVYSTLDYTANSTTKTNDFILTISNPIPTVLLTSSLYQVPIHPDYNTITLLCSDTLPSQVKELAIDKQYSWTVNGTETTNGVQGPVDPDERESYGSLTMSITDLGSTVVACTVSIEVPTDPVISSNDSLTITALAPSAPVSPTDLQSMNVSMTSADVYWTVPYIAYTPEQYIVYYGTSQSSLTSSSAVVNGSTNLTAEYIQYSVTLMGLESDTLYYYRMGSSNTEGATNSTNIGNFTTLRIEVPSEQPRNFTIVTVSSTTVMLRWRSIREEARNAPITSYSISCNSSHPTHHVDPNPLLEDPDNEEAEYAVNITDLLPYTMYQCKLYANNSGGAGPVVMAGVRTFEDRPSFPTNIQVLGIRPSAVRVTWSKPSVLNGVIVLYTVYTNFLNGTTSFDPIDGGLMEYVVTGLMPYQLVQVSLSASTSQGESQRSGSVEGRTTESAPYALVNVKYHVLSPSRLKVNFTKPSLEIRRGLVLYYVVTVREYNSDEDSGQTATIYGNSTVLEAFIGGLESEIPYNVSVYAVNSAGAGDQTSTVLFTKEGIPPPPDNVMSERINGTHMKVTWTPLSLSRAKGFIINYSISYNRVIAATVLDRKRQSGGVVVPANETTVIIGQLTPSAKYSITVSAINSAGRGIESTTLTVNEFATPEEGGVFTTVNIVIGLCVILGLIVIVVICILVIVVVKRRCGSKNDSMNISPQDHKVIVPAHIETGPSMAYGQLPGTPEPILDCEPFEKSQIVAHNPTYNYAYSKAYEHTYESIDQLRMGKQEFESYDVPKPQLPAPRPSMSNQSSHSTSENS